MGSQKDAHIDHLDSFDSGYVKGLTDAIKIAEECNEECSHCYEIARIIRKKLTEALKVWEPQKEEDPNQLKLPL